jgi:hypothetical protein
MPTLFAPAEILSVFSYAVDGSDPTMILPAGTHLRVLAGGAASFPVTPFVCFQLPARGMDTRGVHITDRRGVLAGNRTIAQLGTADLIPLLIDTDTVRAVRVDLSPNPAGTLDRVQLLDQHTRLIAERDREPFAFSAPVLHRFRVSGSADSVGLAIRSVDLQAFLKSPAPAVTVAGLPVEGLHSWYLGVGDRATGLARAADGAPLFLNPMDRPDGPFDPVDADAEQARVEALLAGDGPGGGLEALIASLVDDSTVPWQQVDKTEATGADGRDQIAVVPRLGALNMAAVDPGLGRFVGYATRFDELPRPDGWGAIAVAAIVAVDPASPIGAQLATPAPGEGGLLDLIAHELGTAAGRDLSNDLHTLIDAVRREGLLARALVAVTAPVAPWLPPTLQDPQVLDHHWQAATDETPSSLYRAAFAFPTPPLAALCAVGLEANGEWQSRHTFLDVAAAAPPQRATPRILGHERESFSRLRALFPPAGIARHAALASDENLPAEGGTLRYRFSGSDLFGRFGTPVETTLDPPDRPPPPPPTLRQWIAPAVIDPASAAPLSPGTLELVFAVPTPPPAARFAAADADRVASAVLVPAISDLAAGAQPITTATVTFDGSAQTIDVSNPGFVPVSFPIRALQPQESVEIELTATFSDGARVSPQASALVTVTDMRPPNVVPTGIGLFWTSEPSPAPDVQLQLAWPGVQHYVYRVYATDKEGLGLTAADLAEPGNAPPSRARIGEVGANKVLGGAHVDRSDFRLLTREPVPVGSDGRAIFQGTLPRSLESVQFLRVVPVTPDGAEAPFDGCGIVPLAVPESRRPVSPRLEASMNQGAGIATLTVVADGFDGVALRRDEPGLFGGPAAAATAPRYRLRRAVSAIADPVYAPQIAAGDLALLSATVDGVVFSATAEDGNAAAPLEPFVRFVYWADVQLPPERRLPVGVAPIDPPGGISVLDPANASDQPRPLSLPSAPVSVMHLPQNPPAKPAAAAITVARAAPDASGTVDITVEIANPPTAHPSAIGPYTLAVWTQWQGQPIEPASIFNGATVDPGTWPDITTGSVTVTVAPATAPGVSSDPIQLRLAFVDPTGRVGDVSDPINT